MRLRGIETFLVVGCYSCTWLAMLGRFNFIARSCTWFAMLGRFLDATRDARRGHDRVNMVGEIRVNPLSDNLKK